MSQARLTDFFSQRKRGARGAAKAAGKPHGGAAGPIISPAHDGDETSALCFSPVRAEFVRVIDEAAGSVPPTEPSKELRSPHTPKRSSADAQFDVAAAAAERASVKKRRQAGGSGEAERSEKTTRRTARKKLLLAADKPQIPAGSSSRGLGKEDISALRSRVQRIRKQSEDIGSSASSASCPTPSNRAAPAVSSNPTGFAVARARELAAKAQRRKEEREAGQIKPTETQTADSSAEQPGYQRYHSLAQAVPPGLSLPYQYKILAEMFRSMDTVIAMLYNRSETATFAKIKQGVQDMIHKRFEECHMSQIKTVFPEAYTFRQERNVPTFNSHVPRGSYQLTVEPVIRCDQNEVWPVLSASRLLERRHTFHLNLVSVVKQHHQAFLSSLVPPVSVPEDSLTRWHPRFNVDTVPAVPLSALPRAPHTEKVLTAQEVLDKARSLVTPKMEQALVSLAQNTEDKDGETAKAVCSQSPAAPAAAAQVPPSLKGVSHTLLDRIRAKEAQKLQAAMTRDPAQEERLLMMSRLAELARILRNVFVAEKKAALVMEFVCNRMVASYRSALSPGDMEKHLRLLSEVAPDWLSIHHIRKDFYLKLNKMVEVGVILDKLSHRLKEEERL